MARYPSGGQLPPINWDDRDSPNQAHAAGHGGAPSWQEKSQRAAYQEQIQTVTRTIQKLSKEIESIEEQLQKRDRASEHTNNSVKTLEVQHVGSVADLRQRVGRCDVSIAKLSGDSRRMAETLTAFSKQMQDSSAHQARIIADQEAKISRLETQLNQVLSQQQSRVSAVESEARHAAALLEAKTRNDLDELQRGLESLQTRGDGDRQMLERELTTMTETAMAKRDSQQERFEKKLMNRIDDLEKKLSQQEGALRNMSDDVQATLGERLKQLERSLRRDQQVFEAESRRELKELSEQSEGGFKRVGESMATLRTILEGKHQLLADNLQKQVANAKKLFVLT